MAEKLYKIYQFKEGVDDKYRFNTEGLKNNELSRKDYTCVYMGKISDLLEDRNMTDEEKLDYISKLTDEEKLDYIYDVFNLNHPADFEGHSLSVGDIVELDVDGWSHSSSIRFNPSEKVYCVDDFGFTLIPDFYSEEKKQWCEVYDLQSWGGKLHICELSDDNHQKNSIKFPNGYTMRLSGSHRKGTARADIFNEKGELLNKAKDFSQYSGRLGDVVLKNGERYIAWVVPSAPAHIIAAQETRYNDMLEATLEKFQGAERKAGGRKAETQRQRPQREAER